MSRSANKVQFCSLKDNLELFTLSLMCKFNLIIGIYKQNITNRSNITKQIKENIKR